MEQVAGFVPEDGVISPPNPTMVSLPCSTSEVTMHIGPCPGPSSLGCSTLAASSPPVGLTPHLSLAQSPRTSPAIGPPDERPPQSRRNKAAHSRRRKRRVAAACNPLASLASEPTPPPLSSYTVSAIPVQADAEKFNVAGSGGYIGDRGYRGRKTPWSLAELQGLGFTYVKWDGACVDLCSCYTPF